MHGAFKFLQAWQRVGSLMFMFCKWIDKSWLHGEVMMIWECVGSVGRDGVCRLLQKGHHEDRINSVYIAWGIWKRTSLLRWFRSWSFLHELRRIVHLFIVHYLYPSQLDPPASPMISPILRPRISARSIVVPSQILMRLTEPVLPLEECRSSEAKIVVSINILGSP